MDLNLRGKTALVTGSGRGIGMATIMAFAEEGANVVVNDVDFSRVTQVADEARKRGVKALPVKADITCFEDVEKMMRDAINAFGSIDILVNNAGGGDRGKLFTEISMEDRNRVLNLCLHGTLNCNRAVIEHMIKRRQGKIVAIVSDAARVGEARMAIYSAAKAAIVGHIKALAKEVGGYNINVNAISPGTVETESTFERRAAFAEKDPVKAGQRLEKQKKLYPLNRFANKSDIANAVLFLSSDVSSFITGQVLSVNGGYTMI